MKRGGPLKRRTPLTAKKGLARGEPLKRSKGLRSEPVRRRVPPEWTAAKQACCAVCGGRRNLKLHHVIFEQHVRRWYGNPWDPRDALTVCMEDHDRHHDGSSWKIPVAKLTVENLAFALDLMGDYAADYLAKHYAGSREEIEARLGPRS